VWSTVGGKWGGEATSSWAAPTCSCHQALSFEFCSSQPLFSSCNSNKLDSEFKEQKMVSGRYPASPGGDNGLSDASADGEISGDPYNGESSSESYRPKLT